MLVDLVVGVFLQLFENWFDVKVVELVLVDVYYIINQVCFVFYFSVNIIGILGWINGFNGIVIFNFVVMFWNVIGLLM